MSRDQSSDQHYWNHQELIRLLHQYHHRAIMDHPERFQSRMDQQSGEEANFHRYLQSVCTQIVPPATRHLQNGSVFSTWKPHKQRRPNTTLTPTKVKSQPSVKSTLSDLRTKFTWFGRSDGSVERSRSHQDINYPPRMIDAWNTESDEPTVLETQNLRNSLSEQKISSVLHPHPVFNPKTPVPHSNAAVILGFNPEANGKSNGNGHAFDRHSPNLEFLQKLNKQYGSVERYSVYLKLIALIHLLLGLFMLIFDLAPPAMLWHMPEDPSRLRYKHLCRLMYPCLIVALGVMTLAASKRRKTITLVLTISSVSLFAFGFIAPPQMPFVESELIAFIFFRSLKG